MEREPMEMPTKFGLIVFQRENRGRIAAEKLATVLRTAGIMVAFMEDFKDCRENITEEYLYGLDFILLPKKTYAIFPLFPEETKICYYSEKDNLLEVLLERLDQAEANELRKIEFVLETYDLFSFLSTANLNIMFAIKSFPVENKFFDFEEAIKKLKADIYSTMHIGFASLYLKHIYNVILDKKGYICKHFQSSIHCEMESFFDEAHITKYLSLLFLLSDELTMDLMQRVSAYRYYYKMAKLTVNPFIKNELILDFKFYLHKYSSYYDADKLSQKYFKKLLPCMEVKYFFCFSTMILSKHEKNYLTDQIKQFKEYLKIHQKNLEEDLENFTPIELTYFFKICLIISRNYISMGKVESDIAELNPFEAVLIEKAKHYHLKNHADGLKRGVALFGLGIYDWTTT